MIGFGTEFPMVNIYEEVFAWGYRTNGDFWWIGTKSGYHEVKL